MTIHSISLLLLPVLFHIALFHRNLFIAYHMTNLLAIISFAFIYLHHTERFKLLYDYGKFF